jgi:hypothetical protein
MPLMAIITHAPESRAFRGEDEARHLQPAFARSEAVLGDGAGRG